MKVLILTKHEYLEFIKENYLQYNHEHSFYVWANDEPFPWDENYDVGISFMYTYKVPAKEIKKHTWYNFHPAPLPEYKGRNLCYHAIMNGETRFGASIHYMDENFDTGPIIDVRHTTIGEYQTAGDVYREAIETAKGLFEEYLPYILVDFPLATIFNIGGRYYKKEPIDERVYVNAVQKDRIRAITANGFYPYIDIGGRKFRITPEDE